MKLDDKLIEKTQHDINGDNHIMTSIETPMKEDAFAKSDEEKISNIEKLFGDIMEELGLDLTDDSLKGTPYRVAKMYVKEIFEGLNPEKKPSLSVFDNKYQYNKMLVEKDITFNSACEHHFLPIVGKAHVGGPPRIYCDISPPRPRPPRPPRKLIIYHTLPLHAIIG